MINEKLAQHISNEFWLQNKLAHNLVAEYDKELKSNNNKKKG
jgi:hypothetical protein